MSGKRRTSGLTDKPRIEEIEEGVAPLVTSLVLGALGAGVTEAAAEAVRKQAPLPEVGVVLPAGGRGLRAGGPEPKQFLSLSPGRPMLLYSIEAFHGLDCVKRIVLVLPPDRLEAFSGLTAYYPKLSLASGGDERWHSVRNGVSVLDPALPFVAVHDVARPFVSEAVIRRCLEAVSAEASVLAALPATDTVKEVAGDLVKRTLDRRDIALAQTPQVFPRQALDRIHAADWSGRTPTDEASMAEALGLAVRWVRGSEANRKVTGTADLAWAGWMAGRLAAGETLPDD